MLLAPMLCQLVLPLCPLNPENFPDNVFIESLELQLHDAQRKRDQSFVQLAMDYADAGISQQLFDAYEEFCTSLEPEFGQRGGFSITCFGQQKKIKKYTRYDPQYELFKQNVEMPYAYCNFRCEPSSVPSLTEEDTEEDIVEFWPIPSPEPRSGRELTWGDQYVSLIYVMV